MKTNLKIIALIPARSGSKGLPHKNIKFPAYTLEHHNFSNVKIKFINPY